MNKDESDSRKSCQSFLFIFASICVNPQKSIVLWPVFICGT